MKQTSIIILIMFLMSAVCGCTADIQTTTVHGMTKVMTSIELKAMDMLSTNNQEVIRAGDSISWEYSNDTMTVEIVADVNGVDPSKIQTGTLTFFEFDQETAINTLFTGDKENLTETYVSESNAVRIVAEPDANGTSEYGQELQIATAGFSYTNTDLMVKNYTDGEIIDSNVKTMELTQQQAKDTVINLLKELGITNISITDVETLYSETTQKEFYQVYFSLQLDQIAFENTNGFNPDIVKLTGSATIGDEGLGSISGNLLLTPYEAEYIGNILSVENILEILPDYIDAYYSYADYIYIDDIELNYCVIVNDAGEIEFFPVWILNINETNSSDNSLLRNHIMINAVTGQLETLD